MIVEPGFTAVIVPSAAMDATLSFEEMNVAPWVMCAIMPSE